MMFRQLPERDHLIVEKLQQAFSPALLAHEIQQDMLCLSVSKTYIFEVLSFLRDQQDMQYNFLTSLCGMHTPDDDLPLGLVYHLHSLLHNHRIRIKTNTSLEDPHFPSATPLWEAANWMERETYDFFGIYFDGHPKLKRILNVDDFEGFPLRKDFPLEDQGREDKNDAMFGR